MHENIHFDTLWESNHVQSEGWVFLLAENESIRECAIYL
jgi:hypothetical protein